MELDPAAVFEFRQAGRTQSEVTLTWASLPDETYRVRHTAFLENPTWTTASTQQAIGTLTHFTDTDPVRANQSPSFYQVVAGGRDLSISLCGPGGRGRQESIHCEICKSRVQ